MAPTRASNPSVYFFSASRRSQRPKPTLVEAVACSPPRRQRGIGLTITRVFKVRRGVSLKKVKESSKKHRVTAAQGSYAPPAAPPAVPSSSKRAGTPGPSTFLRAESPKSVSTHHAQVRGRGGSPLDPLRDMSPLSSPTPSPPPEPSPPSVPKAVARARKVDNAKTSASAVRHTSDSVAAPVSTGRLTRSMSRSSITTKGKINRKASFSAIEERLDPNGGIVTRYGVQDGEPIFIKKEKNTSSTDPSVLTAWWESFTAVPLRHPPDLTSRPDLDIGDVYCNIVRGEANSVQLWIWTASTDGTGFWKRAAPGDVREDGRRLTVTSRKLQPSWVGTNWAQKQLNTTTKK